MGRPALQHCRPGMMCEMLPEKFPGPAREDSASGARFKDPRRERLGNREGTTVQDWEAKTPKGFTVSAKVPSLIAHEKCLLDCDKDFVHIRDGLQSASTLSRSQP